MRATRLTSIVAVVALLFNAPKANANCVEAMSPDNARKLFGALKNFRGADGCVLENVQTERDVTRVEWSRGGVKQPAVTVFPKSCAPPEAVVGPALAMSAPETVVQACPAAIAEMTTVIQRDTFGGLVRTDVGKPAPARARPWKFLGIVLLVLLAPPLAFAIVRRRRR